MMGQSVTFFYHTWGLLFGFLGFRVDIFFSLEYFHPLPYILPYFLLSLSLSQSVAFDSLRLFRLQPTRLLCPWDSPGKNTRVGCHFLLQGTFLDPGLNPHLPVSSVLQADLLSTVPLGKPIFLGIIQFSSYLSYKLLGYSSILSNFL